MASSSMQPVAPSIGYPVLEKLGCNNFVMWKAWILMLRDAQMAYLINADYELPAKEIA